MSTLYIETTGSGPALVALHGWGLHGGVWEPLRSELARRFRLQICDLPGFGLSGESPLPEPSAEAYAEAVLAACPGPALWMGWSLGAQVALAAARLAPARVTGLVLIAATPKFLAAPDWPHAMPAASFAGFAAELERDYRGALMRFLSLQLGDEETARDTLRSLRARLFERPDPSPAALAAGLRLLERTDLRARLRDIAQPALIVHGARDRLVPCAAGEYLAGQLPQARLAILARAGHVPFLTQGAEFLDTLGQFIHDIETGDRRSRA